MDKASAKLDEKDLKQEALKICQEFLGSPWNKVVISDFKFSTLSGGLSNYLYRCSLPDEMTIENPKTPRQVLLRLYGPLQEEEAHVIVIEATTFMLLSERQLGPKLYGVFPNGRLEEFIPSRSLNTDDIRQMSTTIARELAKIHALEVPVRKEPDMWIKFMKRWLQDVENETMRIHNKSFPLLSMYQEETDWLLKEMEETQSPVVYCHNDLQGGNILLCQDSLAKKEPNLVLIDFEFGCYNYRGFDIANQFCEWIFDYNTKEPPHFTMNIHKYPTKEERIRYIKAYLDQLVSEGVLDASEVDTETKKILKEIKVFGMAAYLLWSLWSEKMKFISCLDFSHIEHGNTRRKLFKSLKEKYLKKKSHLCNGCK